MKIRKILYSVLLTIFFILGYLLYVTYFGYKYNKNELKQIIQHKLGVKVSTDFEITRYTNDIQESGLISLLNSDCYEKYEMYFNKEDYMKIYKIFEYRNSGQVSIIIERESGYDYYYFNLDSVTKKMGITIGSE